MLFRLCVYLSSSLFRQLYLGGLECKAIKIVINTHYFIPRTLEMTKQSSAMNGYLSCHFTVLAQQLHV